MRKRKAVYWLAAAVFLMGLLFCMKPGPLSAWSAFDRLPGVQSSDGGEAADFAGRQEQKKICLTFDDGPHPLYTPPLLDGLKERNVKATFFLTGQNAAAYPELVKRMAEEGHVIGNHTYHHVSLKEVGGERFREEIVSTNEVLEELSGTEIEFIRPPYGVWDKRYEKELGMIPVMWNVDPLDWCRSNVQGIVQDVLKGAEENAVILMHDQYPSSVTAALSAVDALQKQGYEFVTVEQILFD